METRNWRRYVKSKKFVKEIRDEDGIDFFHYDLDKTYDGKKSLNFKKLFKPESI